MVAILMTCLCTILASCKTAIQEFEPCNSLSIQVPMVKGCKSKNITKLMIENDKKFVNYIVYMTNRSLSW